MKWITLVALISLGGCATQAYTVRPAEAEEPRAEGFARFIESLDDLRWGELLEKIPPEIADADAAALGELDTVTAQDLEALLR